MAKVDLDSIKSNALENDVEVKKQRVKPDPVIQNNSIVKKSFLNRAVEFFVGEDVQDAKSYLINEYVIPRAKDSAMDFFEIIADGAHDLLFAIFFGVNESSSYHRRYVSHGSRKNYRKMYRDKTRPNTSRSRDREDEYFNKRSSSSKIIPDDEIDYTNIILTYRDDAERLVDAMRNHIREYGSASIADLLNMVDLPNEYTDENWGWTRQEDIGIRRVAKGFLITLARVVPLED